MPSVYHQFFAVTPVFHADESKSFGFVIGNKELADIPVGTRILSDIGCFNICVCIFYV
jgi:hypothetical protein